MVKLVKGTFRSMDGGRTAYQRFCKYCDTPLIWKWVVTKNWGHRNRSEKQYCPSCEKLRHNCNQVVEKRTELRAGRIAGETKEERKARLIAITMENIRKRKEAEDQSKEEA